LDILGSRPFRCENHYQSTLDFFGFPWILSSESRLFNELHGILREKFFLALLSLAWAISDGGIRFWHPEVGDCSWGKAYPDF
jgi:hypothetical protein